MNRNKEQAQQHMTKTVCNLKYLLSGSLQKKFANVWFIGREILCFSQACDYTEQNIF